MSLLNASLSPLFCFFSAACMTHKMKGEGVSEMRGQEVVLSLDLSLKHTWVGEEKWAVTPWEKPSSF